MSALSIDYKGYKIEYVELYDKWSCRSIGYEAATLSACKKLVDKFDLEERRIQRVPVISSANTWGSNRFERVFVTSVDNPEADRKYQDAWVVSSSKTRSKISLGNLLKDEPETHRKVAEYKRLCAEADRIRKEADAVLASIPRITLEEIKELSEEIKAKDL